MSQTKRHELKVIKTGHLGLEVSKNLEMCTVSHMDVNTLLKPDILRRHGLMNTSSRRRHINLYIGG